MKNAQIIQCSIQWLCARGRGSRPGGATRAHLVELSAWRAIFHTVWSRG